MNGFFLIAYGDSAEIFQLAKQAFNGVALPVMPTAIVSLFLSVGLGRNDGLDPFFLKPSQKCVGVIALSAKQACADRPSISGLAWVIAAACPSVRINFSGNPSASATA